MKPFAGLRGYLRQQFGIGAYKVRASGEIEVLSNGVWKLYGKTGVDDNGEFWTLTPWAESLNPKPPHGMGERK
jgi:hypothetical protein